MPSTITHAFFSMDLYDKFDVKKKKQFEPYLDKLKTFAQGPDVFFFYNIFSPLTGKNIRDMGHYMHKNKTQDFFVNLICEIKSRRLEKNKEVLSFLYGFVAHYILDMTMHPYVIYRSGIYNKKNKSTYKYFSNHEKTELYIDAYLIKNRLLNKPSHFKTHKFALNTTSISKKLSELLDATFYKTFNEKNVGKKYITSIKEMNLFYKLFRNDYTGIKKQIYKLGNHLPLPTKLELLSYNINLNNDEYYLNLNKDTWHHPLDKTVIHNYSIIELYVIALDKALKLIQEIDTELIGVHNLDHLKTLFPNLSYLTGFKCEIGDGKYFSY